MLRTSCHPGIEIERALPPGPPSLRQFSGQASAYSFTEQPSHPPAGPVLKACGGRLSEGPVCRVGAGFRTREVVSHGIKEVQHGLTLGACHHQVHRMGMAFSKAGDSGVEVLQPRSQYRFAPDETFI